MFKRLLMLFAVAMVVFGAFAASVSESSAPAKAQSVVVTDMVGRQVEIVPGSYTRVVCIGAGALRL